MARYRGQKALYEVMSKARAKSERKSPLELLRPKKTQTETPVNEPVVEQPQVTTKWRTKPRMVQINAGRIEFSVHYQLAITIGLVLILLLMIAYKFGMASASPPAQPRQNRPAGTETPAPALSALGENPAGHITSEVISRSPAPAENLPAPAATSKGDHVIVLAEVASPSALEPVKQYFDKNGITLEIVPAGNKYFLQTVNKYENPDKLGTDGNKAKMEIIRIGKGYKAPTGYDSFAPRLFSDAYGKKVN